MNAAIAQHQHLGFFDKLLTNACWIGAAVLFLTVGWIAMAPDDPQGAVSTLARSGGPMMVLQAAMLAAVVAALATAVAGRRLVEIGTFAAAIGLAAVSLKGETAAYLLVRDADAASISGSNSAAGLTGDLVLESLWWFLVVLVAVVVSAIVMRVCYGVAGGGESDAGESPLGIETGLAGYELPAIGRILAGATSPPSTVTRRYPLDGVKHTAITLGAALALITFLSIGLSNRAITHGQVCFVVWAAFWLAGFFGHHFAPVRTALWPILAVGLLPIVAYLSAAISTSPFDFPPSIPKSHFLRILPIQYVGVGTAAAIAGMWSFGRSVAIPESRGPSGQKPRAKRELG